MTGTTASVLLKRLRAKARLRHLQVLADLDRLAELPQFEGRPRGVRIMPVGQQQWPVDRRMLEALAWCTCA